MDGYCAGGWQSAACCTRRVVRPRLARLAPPSRPRLPAQPPHQPHTPPARGRCTPPRRGGAAVAGAAAGAVDPAGVAAPGHPGRHPLLHGHRAGAGAERDRRGGWGRARAAGGTRSSRGCGWLDGGGVQAASCPPVASQGSALSAPAVGACLPASQPARWLPWHAFPCPTAAAPPHLPPRRRLPSCGWRARRLWATPAGTTRSTWAGPRQGAEQLLPGASVLRR